MIALFVLSSCSNAPENLERLPDDTIEIKHPNGTLFSSEKYVETIKNMIPQDTTPFALQLSEEVAVKVQKQQKDLFEKYGLKNYLPEDGAYQGAAPCFENAKTFHSFAKSISDNKKIIEELTGFPIVACVKKSSENLDKFKPDIILENKL